MRWTVSFTSQKKDLHRFERSTPLKHLATFFEILEQIKNYPDSLSAKKRTTNLR